MNIADFLKRCETYCERRGISAARLSTILFNDGKKLGALAGGVDVGVRRLERAVAELAKLEAAERSGRKGEDVRS